MKIPTYESQVSPTGISSLPGSLPGERRKAIIGEFVPATGLENVVNAISDIDKRMEAVERAEQFNDALKVTDDNSESLYRDAQQDTSKTWGNLTIDEHLKKAGNRYDEILEEARSKIKDSDALLAFNKYAEANRVDLISKIKHIAWTRGIDRKKAKSLDQISDNDDKLTLTGNMIYLARTNAIIDGDVATQVYTQTEGQALKKNAANKGLLNYGRHLYTLEPIGSADRIKRSPLYLSDAPDENVKDAIIREAMRAERVAKSGVTKTNYTAITQYEKIDKPAGLKYIENNGDEDGSIAKRLHDQIDTSYSEEHRGPAHLNLTQDLKKAHHININIQRNKTEPVSVNEVYSKTLDVKNAADPTDADISDFAKKDFDSRLEHKKKGLKNDPKGIFDELWPNKINDTELSIAWQLSNGLTMDNVSVISKARAENIANEVRALPADKAVARLGEIDKEFSKNGRDFIARRDLVKYGKLPVGMILATYIDTNTKRDGKHTRPLNDIEKKEAINKRTLAVEASKLKLSDLKPLISSAKLRDINRQIGTTLAPYIKTIDDNSVNTQWTLDLTDAIRKQAAYDVVHNGKNPTTAAEDAASIIADTYNYRDKLRVPKDFDFDMITETLDKIKKLVGAESLSKGYSEGAVNKIIEDGDWKTNDATDNGAIMVDERGYPVYLRSGKVFSISFDDVQDLGEMTSFNAELYNHLPMELKDIFLKFINNKNNKE